MIKLNEFVLVYQAMLGRFNQKFDKLNCELDYSILKDEFLNIEEFKETVFNLLKKRVYKNMPMPADILQFKKGNSQEELELKASQQWRIVINNLNYSVRRIFFDNRITQQTVAEIGYIYLCKMNIEEIPFMLKRFINTWITLYRRNDNRYPMLYGEIENSHDVYVGNRSEIIAIYNSSDKHLQLTQSESKKLLNEIQLELEKRQNIGE